jgi:membrane associated rhomboid family serine protease
MVLPIGDVNPTRRFAVVSWTLVVVNVAVFLLLQLPLAGCDLEVFIYRYGAIPRELTSLSSLPPGELEALLGACAAEVAGKDVGMSAVTAMFLHGNLAHLLGNMLYLAIFGPNVEDRLGRLRFVAFYLVGGVAATATFALMRPGSLIPLVGASGAIAAILGAYLIVFPRAKVFTLVPFPLYLVALVLPKVRIRAWLIFFAVVSLPAWLLLAAWFAMQFVAVRSPVSDGVAYEAHVAGFVAGIVLLLLLDRRRHRRGQPTFHPVRRPPRPQGPW